MSLYEDWMKKAFSQEGRSIEAVWEEYLPRNRKSMIYPRRKVTKLEGTIAAVCVDNGQIVEFGQPLVRILPEKEETDESGRNQKILPHRDHMLLIDEAELREGKAYGKKTIRGDEFSCRGISPVILLSPVSFSAKFWGRARVFCFPVRQRALPPSLRDWIRCALKPRTSGGCI